MATPFPKQYNDPAWGKLFETLANEDVDAACLAWFEQWTELKNPYVEGRSRFLECASMLHALSNRTDAPLDNFIGALERHDNGDAAWTEGYMWSRKLFASVVTAAGWTGIALRCWTDPRGYAGYLQYIESNGWYEHLGDLASSTEVAPKLSEALALYGDDLAYPWIAAACIRVALFGENLVLGDVPETVRWLKALYDPLRDQLNTVDPQTLLAKPVEFGGNSGVVHAMLDIPDLWAHMLLQEGAYDNWRATRLLWCHWANCVGHPRVQEAQVHWKTRDTHAMLNSMMQGSDVDLELMRMMGIVPYLMHRAKRHHLQDSLALPEMGPAI